jgi:hypothetical protein
MAMSRSMVKVNAKTASTSCEARTFPWLLQAGHADIGVTSADKAKAASRAFREIKHAAPDKWAPIVDAHHDRLAIALVGYLDPGAERQGAMSGGESGGIHPFAGSGSRMKGVPGSTATGRTGTGGYSAQHQKKDG